MRSSRPKTPRRLLASATPRRRTRRLHVRHLSLANFRSYTEAELGLRPGVTLLMGRNGEGKTNLVEAIGYLATLGSHRVATDAPLIKHGHDQAIIRAAIIHDGREQQLEVRINAGRANQAQVGRGNPSRARDALGIVRTVLFAPEDLTLVKGDPSERRRFLDDLLVQRQPKWAATRADYDRVIKQRNALLKTSGALLAKKNRGATRRSSALAADEDPTDATASVRDTLAVWDTQLAGYGARLLYARLRLLADLQPLLTQAYSEVSDSSVKVTAHYRASFTTPSTEQLAVDIAAGTIPSVDDLEQAFTVAASESRQAEAERGVTLFGPHRDDLVLSLGELPAKGYASHGESWSFALALKLGAFALLRRDLHTDPVLILDDVFAELDSGRRERLADLISDAEQVIITAAVAADVPSTLAGQRFTVANGQVQPDESDSLEARPSPSAAN